MPFYEYECSSCKFYTEVMQKITDTPLTKCPSCGKKALVKLVSAPNFRLKGAGWYETDFKGDKENKRNLAGGEADEASSSPESKPETASSQAPKPEPAKADAEKAAAPAKTPIVSGTRKPKPTAGKTASGGRSSRPAGKAAPARAAAAKARPAAARKSKPAAAKKGRAAPSRSKAKPAAKKKARR